MLIKFIYRLYWNLNKYQPKYSAYYKHLLKFKQLHDLKFILNKNRIFVT